MSVGDEARGERHEKVRLDLGRLRRLDWRQLSVRFAFGAVIAAAAGLVGQRFGDRAGGGFLAFPAILPAALTLLERSDGMEKTDVDAAGATLGAVALLAFAVVLTLTISRVGPALGIVAASAAWVIVAAALFLAVPRLAALLMRRSWPPRSR